MEFTSGLNINLSNEELDKLLCFDENNKFVTSTPKKQDMAEYNEAVFDLVFSDSSQFKMTKNSPNFDSENISFNIYNNQFMQLHTPQCIKVCTTDSEKTLSHAEIKQSNNLPIDLSTEKLKPSNNSKPLNENNISASSNSNFQISIPTCLQSLDISTCNYDITLNQAGQFNKQLIQKYSEDKNYIPDLCTNIFSKRDFNQIPVSIMELYKCIRNSYSDFAFVYAISAQMCQEFIPMDCYLNLKMCLILSIASLTKNNKPIPIVAIGPDSSLINKIMLHFGQNIPQRFLAPVSDLESIGGTINHENMIQAGPAILAKGGICYLGDWCHIKPNHADKILKEIERSTLCIDKSNLNYPLQCSIWCYWTGSFKNNVKDRRMLNTFMEIFGVPVMLGEKAGGDVLVDFIFEQAIKISTYLPQDELSIPLNDMKEFLKIIGNRKVDFNTEALYTMQKYFVASRIDRPDCLTQQSFRTLKVFSESFAKLSLRSDVIVADVIASIYLTEYSIQNIFGTGICPSPEFQSVNNYIGEIDNFMQKFENWLKEYINRFN